MKFFKNFNMFESSLAQAKAELKDFQDELDIDINLSKLLNSIDAVELSVNTIFPFIEGGEMIDTLDDKQEFQDELDERKLKISELFDTDDNATLIKVRMKYYWIYPEDSSELDMPLYIMLQFYSHKKEKWSKIKLYYVQKDVDNFYQELSTVTMEIRKKGDSEKKWIYTTSNSGQNWVLKNQEKATSTFRKTMDMEEIEKLAKHTATEIVFY